MCADALHAAHVRAGCTSPCRVGSRRARARAGGRSGTCARATGRPAHVRVSAYMSALICPALLP
eukprot:800196-Rhodomonas_salina.1